MLWFVQDRMEYGSEDEDNPKDAAMRHMRRKVGIKWTAIDLYPVLRGINRALHIQLGVEFLCIFNNPVTNLCIESEQILAAANP